MCTFRFQDAFAKLEADGIEGLSFPAIDGSKAEQKSEIIKLCKNIQNEHFIRGYYKELVKLLLLYLDEENRQQGFKWFYLPALHRARWMSKLIYCIKLDLLREKIIKQLPKGAVFASGQQKK